MFRGTNIPENEKSKRLKPQEEHLQTLHEQRSLYNNMVHDARKVCSTQGLTDLKRSTAMSQQMTMHYSFDYAHQTYLVILSSQDQFTF